MLRTYRDEYERLLPLVEKPGRYLGNERGVVHKPLDLGLVRVALAFPEVYEIAQSHLGLQILYHVLNRRADVAAERAYAPWGDLEQLLRERALPLVSLESHLPLRDFHVVGFSLQYELTYTNLLTMLELGGIPRRAAERSARDPLVIAGGPCAFNPEPLAPFLDVVVLGDGEEAIGDLVDVVKAWDGQDRLALLRAAAGIAGCYVPAFFEPRYAADGTLTEVVALDPERPTVRKRVLPDLDRFPPPDDPVVPNIGVVHDRASVEVMRGCVKGCRFCQAGYVYRPLRERNPERVVADTTALMARTGYEEVSLLSLSTGDYSGVNPVLKALMDRLAPERIAVSLPSTRVDALSPKILEQIRRVRKTGFTLAPEAGTQRLRDVIQKEYREDELLDAARLFADLGWRALKLYFMIGLPSETEDDVRGIAILAERVKRAARGRLKVTASVSTFSPKPHTPFQWAGELSPEETEARHTLLRRELARRGIEFRWHHPRLTWLEGIFARGDRRLAAVIESAHARGARFDGWSDQCRFDAWEGALAEHGVDPARYLRRRPLDEILPWDHLDAGLSKKFLQQDLARAVAGQLTPDCSVERCTYCGACDFETIRNVDFHPEGAKGSQHRGDQISRWAELLVPADDATDPLPAWETRTWRGIRTRVAARRAAREPVTARPSEVHYAPLPDVLAGTAALPAAGGGEGQAEEWLGAIPSSLAPQGAAARPVQRLRLRYAKIGPARFVGTRELGTIFLRACRRAGLPLAFSNGHHPLPRIGFGPALPVGYASDDELVDIELVERRDDAAVVDALAAELPDGLVLQGGAEIAAGTPSIDQSVSSFVYDIDLRDLPTPPAPRIVGDAVARFLGCETVPVRKRTPNGERTVNARTAVLTLTVTGPSTLRVAIAVRPDGTLKPGLVVAALLDLPDATIPLLRIHKRATRVRDVAASPSSYLATVA